MQQIDFSQGSIRRRILAVATPMLIAQLLNLLYNIVDRIYIGKIPGEGTLALASIGLCFPFVRSLPRLPICSDWAAHRCARWRAAKATEKAHKASWSTPALCCC